MRGFKRVPRSDDLWINKQGTIVSEHTGKALDLRFDPDNPIPRLKINKTKTQSYYVCVCFHSNEEHRENKYTELSVAKIMVELFLGEEHFRKLGKSRFVRYKDENFKNLNIDNIELKPYEVKKKNGKRKRITPGKKHRRLRKCEEDASWMTGDDTYF